MCASYKHASLWARSISNEEKSFVRMPLGFNIILFFVTDSPATAVSGKHFHSSVAFASKAGDHLSGFICVLVTNTLAYWPVASVTKKKSFCMYATYIQNTFFFISESPGTPVSDKHFHSSVAFASKAGTHLSGFKDDSYKHASLLSSNISNEEKSFCENATWSKT